MSVIEEQALDVNVLIPDGIEPVEALRCWGFDGHVLTSLNGVIWKPGEAHEAKCLAADTAETTYSWNVVRAGLTLVKAKEVALAHNERGSYTYYGGATYSPPSYIPPPPEIALPEGYGFNLDKTTHDAPHERCTCGVYAATTDKQLPSNGEVYGKAKLWGKVVPGERGVRAQYAYPSEFHVPAKLADNPILKAFGVPVIVKDSRPSEGGLTQFISTNVGAPRKHRIHWAVKASVGANLAACAFNLVVSYGHLT